MSPVKKSKSARKKMLVKGVAGASVCGCGCGYCSC
jgi:hypothetical protein